SRLLRSMCQDRLEGAVGAPALQQNSENGEATILPAVHEVALEGKAPATQAMLARMMEMELDEVAGILAHDQPAAGLRIDLNGVALVLDPREAAGIAEIELRQVGVNGAIDIDRRLAAADGAGLVVLRQFAPVLRPLAAFVAPMRSACRGTGGADRAKRQA